MRRLFLVTGSLLFWLATEPVAAQNQSIFLLGGYGTAGYQGSTADGFPNNFSASVSPVLLYTMGRNILFEAELEFGLSGSTTTTSLEYAQIDYLGAENFVVTAGKFLLPFGVFGDRLHPTWINKLPTGPVLYGHAHGGVAEEGLLPVLADAGVLLKGAREISNGFALNFSAYVTQGPSLGQVEEHEEETPHAEAPGEEPDVNLPPPVAFGISFEDNNSNKMVGGRVGLVRGPNFEATVSGFRAAYDASGNRTFSGGALSVEFRRGRMELRAEAVATTQEFDSETGVATQSRKGIYAQLSRRIGSWEPVVRWGALSDGKVGQAVTIDGHQEVALGFAYWLEPTVPLKMAWEFHQDRPDRFNLQWAYGF